MKILNSKIKIYIFIVLAFLLVNVIIINVIYFNIDISEKDLEYSIIQPVNIYDRNGVLLRRINSSENGITKIVKLNEINENLVNAFIVTEDKNFKKHKGIDFIALLRALIQNIKNFRIVSGASTITQQTVRNIFYYNRSFKNKIIEIMLAHKLEKIVSKKIIIEQYLNRIPFGNNQYGIYSASIYYLGKEPGVLSIAESAFIASIPQSPAYNDPFRYRKNTEKRKNFILKKMMKEKMITDEQYELALNEKINLTRAKMAFKAPHFCQKVISDLKRKNMFKGIKDIYTTLDYQMYIKVKDIIKSRINSLKLLNVNNSAVVILENKTGNVLVMIGSKDFFNTEIDGQFNAVYGLRQPGSTMKSFTYTIALDNGFTASSLLKDIESRFPAAKGSFIPKNYDRKFHGPVTLRQSLACSYNVSSVYLLNKIGVGVLYNKLKELGCSSLNNEPEFYGLGLTLGNGCMTLMELTRAYTVFPLLGKISKDMMIKKLRYANGTVKYLKKSEKNENIFSEQASYITAEILSDNDSRIPSFGDDSFLNLPFKAGVKTGTSKNYRDNWTVGFNRDITVGVWVGNSDNSPMYSISGIAGAGPVWHDIMIMLYKKGYTGWMKRPENIIEQDVCAVSGMRPGEFCGCTREELFMYGNRNSEVCFFHVNEEEIQYPPEFKHWAMDNGIYNDRVIVQTRNSSSVRDASSSQKTFPEIIFPKNNSKFVIDPDIKMETQAIRMRLILPDGYEEIKWFVNGYEEINGKDKSQLMWNLEKGKYEVYCSIKYNDNWQETSIRTFTVY